MTHRPDDVTLRLLDTGDEPALQELLAADVGYSERVTGGPPAHDEARELLISSPPGLDAARKCVLGAFRYDELVAVVDLLRGWPETRTAHLGLLQVHADHKGTGLGRLVHARLLEWLDRWPEIAAVRAAVVATNAEQAEPFWAAMGYEPTEVRPYTHGDLVTTVRIWTLRR